jgi:hypothetical protein
MSDTVDPNSTINSIEAQLPVLEGDDKKTKYLVYRSAGFSTQESCKLAECHPKSVERWSRQDAEFKRLDTEGLTDLRESVGNKVLYMQFSRNFQYFLKTDFELLKRFMNNEELSVQEMQYVSKARGMYTPQSLGMLQQLLSPDKKSNFDFSKFSITIKQERESIELHTEAA